MPTKPPSVRQLLIDPIGIAHTPLRSKAEAARQPRAAGGCAGTIELFPGRGLEHALADLAGWDMIWVVFWFHLNKGWRPKVLPPRSTSGRKGVFATRSPHRPNPLGLSAVRLERIEGLTLFVRDVDLLDGTPVLDIKPYVPYTDAHPDARSGWLEDTARGSPGVAPGQVPADPVADYAVTFDAMAAAQARWIETRTGLDVRKRITATLSLGPEPHPYRRIRRVGDGYQLAVKEWRVRFSVAGRAMRVLGITSGYRPRQLAEASPGAAGISLHREFMATWDSEGCSIPPH